MTQEPGDVTQMIRLIKMDRVEIRLKDPLMAFVPYAIELAETFADETIEI